MHAQRIIEIAQSQVGVSESTGHNDGIPAYRYSRGRLIPWCATFAVWVYAQAGLKIKGNKWLLPSVQYLEDTFKKHHSWSSPQWYIPQLGDIVFFSNRGSSDAGKGRHCGIVEWCDYPNKLGTIEGNISNSVQRRTYNIDNNRISGYGWMNEKTKSTNSAGNGS